jgi:protoporphyrinogen oxidase
MDAPHVVVVGAGLAGLAAGLALRERGAWVTLLESDAEPGGRARGFARDGFAFDSGAQLLSRADRALLAILEASAAAGALLPLRRVQLAQARGGVLQPIEEERALDVARIRGVRLREALRLPRLGRLERRFAGLLDEPERAARLDDRSAADFARLYLGGSVLERWVEPWLADLGLGAPEDTSRAAFLRARRARAGAELAIPRAPLGVLAAALAEALGARLGCAACAIDLAAGTAGALRVELAGGGALDADAVVLATPPEAARSLAAPLLTAPEREILDRSRSAPAIVLHAALERPLVPVPMRVRVPRGEALPLAALAHEPGAPGGRIPPGRGAASALARPEWSAAHLGAPDEAIEKELLAALERLHPGATREVRFTRVERHRAAYPRFDVGRYRELARLRAVLADRRAQGRRLYLAGDWLAGATCEDAVRSGEEAGTDLTLYQLPPRGSRNPEWG